MFISLFYRSNCPLFGTAAALNLRKLPPACLIKAATICLPNASSWSLFAYHCWMINSGIKPSLPVEEPQSFYRSGESQKALEKMRNTNPRLPKPFVIFSYDKDSKQFFGPKINRCETALAGRSKSLAQTDCS